MTLRRRAARAWRPWVTPLAVMVAAALIGCRQAPGDQRDAALGRMHEACVNAMVASACQVMVGPTPGRSQVEPAPSGGSARGGAGSAPIDAAPTVLIAGVGRIDARAYRELRESGDAMCGVARAACERDWDGASCRGARALWSTQTVASR